MHDNNIRFRYSKGVHPDASLEQDGINNINLRLSEFASELNDENAVVEYWINKGADYHITFKNISPQLHKKVMEELSRFGM